MKPGVLVSLLVASLVMLAPVAAAGNLITGDATRTFTKIIPSVAVSITENVLASAGTPLTEIRLDVNTIVLQARVTVEPTNPEKSGLSVLPGGVVYAYVNITTKNLDNSDLAGVDIDFKVPRNWTSENSVDPSSVKMLRFSSGEWGDLETSVVSEDSEYTHYRASSPGFSVFAIAGESTVVPSEEPVQQTEPPAVVTSTDIVEKKMGDTVTWVVVGIIAVVVLVVLFLLPSSVLRKSFRR